MKKLSFLQTCENNIAEFQTLLSEIESMAASVIENVNKDKVEIDEVDKHIKAIENKMTILSNMNDQLNHEISREHLEYDNLLEEIKQLKLKK